MREPHKNSSHHANGTWLEPEELAYSAYSGRAGDPKNRRRLAALCDDGKVRIFKAGVPDTYFTIPVVGKVGGAYAKGHVYLDGDGDNSESTIKFVHYKGE